MEMDFDTMRWQQVTTSNAVNAIVDMAEKFEWEMSRNNYGFADEYLASIEEEVARQRRLIRMAGHLS